MQTTLAAATGAQHNSCTTHLHGQLMSVCHTDQAVIAAAAAVDAIVLHHSLIQHHAAQATVQPTLAA